MKGPGETDYAKLTKMLKNKVTAADMEKIK